MYHRSGLGVILYVHNAARNDPKKVMELKNILRVRPIKASVIFIVWQKPATGDGIIIAKK